MDIWSWLTHRALHLPAAHDRMDIARAFGEIAKQLLGERAEAAAANAIANLGGVVISDVAKATPLLVGGINDVIAKAPLPAALDAVAKSSVDGLVEHALAQAPADVAALEGLLTSGLKSLLGAL